MKLYNVIISLGLVLGFISCQKDNYDAPQAAISGQVYDQNGKPFQTANGKGSMSIRITETSFAHGDESIVVTPQDLNLRQDGSFENTKLFAGDYEVTPWQGAFYEDVEPQQVQLKNGKTATVNFTVTPYLELEWIKEPYLTSDNTLKASFKFKRNLKDGFTAPDVKDACIWISRTKYCGPEGDGNYTPPTLSLKNSDEGTEIELASKIPIKYSMKYWVRIGARCNDTYQKYNFTDIKEIEVKLN